MDRTPILYTVLPAHPAAHRFEVRCTVDLPDPVGQRFALPAWIPGSYLIRDFARHIVAILNDRPLQAFGITRVKESFFQVTGR